MSQISSKFLKLYYNFLYSTSIFPPSKGVLLKISIHCSSHISIAHPTSPLFYTRFLNYRSNSHLFICLLPPLFNLIISLSKSSSDFSKLQAIRIFRWSLSSFDWLLSVIRFAVLRSNFSSSHSILSSFISSGKYTAHANSSAKLNERRYLHHKTTLLESMVSVSDG